MLVNFTHDLPLIRDYIAGRVRAQETVGEPISAIELCFQLCQAGIVVINFDTREEHENDGTWTDALDGPVLELPHWQAAYESCCDDGISFVLLTGETQEMSAEWLASDSVDSDAVVAAVFGETLRVIALDAFAGGTFAPLSLREDCQLVMEEFDAMWGWSATAEDMGQTNILHRLPE